RSSSAFNVGSAARMRRSLVTLPAASSGTLKSTRTSTRLPFRSGRAASVFLAMGASFKARSASEAFPSLALRGWVRGSTLSHHVAEQGQAAVGVGPLVVVPADQLEEAAGQPDAGGGVEDARRRVVDEVAGDDLVVGVGQDVLEVRLAGALHGGADVLVARL